MTELVKITDEQLKEIVTNSSSWNDVMVKCNLKTLTRKIQRRINNLKIDYTHLPKFYGGLYSKIGKNSKEKYIEILKKYDNWDDILEELNFTSLQCLNNLKTHLNILHIDYSHIKKQVRLKNNSRRIEDILVDDSLYTNMTSLKKRLINELNWKHECSGCNNSRFTNNWVTNVPIPLEIDHINGKHCDNRIENLRFLCPNCHSQTSTYKGKNMRITIENKRDDTPETIAKDILNDIIKKVERNIYKKECEEKNNNKCIDCGNDISRDKNRCIKCNDKNKFITACEKTNRPSLEQLLKDVRELNYTNTGKKYNVSDNSIRKWIRKYQSYEVNT